MKNILSIDTCTDLSSICLGGESVVWRGNKSQSQELLLKIDDLMRTSRIGFDDLEGVFVVNGPGSYTGIRIGVSVANAVAMVCDIPIKYESTILIQAYLGYESGRENSKKIIVSIISAGHNRVYGGMYDCSLAGVSLLGDLFVGEVEDFFGEVKEKDEVLVVADVNDRLENWLKASGFKDVILLKESNIFSRAMMGVKLFDKLHTAKNNVVVPVYLRGAIYQQ